MLNIPIKDYFRETRIFGSRLTFMAVVVVLTMIVLLGRLLYLQVVHHKHFATRAQANKVSPFPIPPVRGLIFDRNGVVLAQNFPAYTLEIIPEQVADIESTLSKLGKLINLGARDLQRFHRQLKKRPGFESLVLRTNLTDEEAARIAINRPHLHGVELHARLQRHYPQGGLGVHAIGFVGRINEQEMDRINRAAYRGTQYIGKLGIEKSYESLLLGKVGVEHIETDARGRRVGEIEREAPQAGHNLYLSIDARLQAAAEKMLTGRRGAVVVMDPNSGAILTLASMPIYNPNPFVSGIDQQSYDRLLEDPDKPLINRALNGQYPPGSVIKPFIGLAGLATGKINPDNKINCRGIFRLRGEPRPYRDWKRGGHGEVNLHEAIVQSCDVYFYQTALKLGINRIHDYLLQLGFGKSTGIDLNNESRGLVPSTQWREARGEKWYLGETVVTGIGQGPILVTPLQLVNAVSLLANGGRLIEPRLMYADENPVTRERRYTDTSFKQIIPIEDLTQIETIIKAMEDVVHSKRGTARRIGWNASYRIAGKTGTAQVKKMALGKRDTFKNTPERLRDHALFIAFAPVDNPRIAIAVIVENGGHGSRTAAPIARKLMDYFLLPETLPPLKLVRN